MSAERTVAPLEAAKPPAPQLRDATDIRLWLGWRDASLEASQDARTEAERDEDYVNNKQLEKGEVAKLKKRGQPYGTFNMIRRKVDFVLGDEMLSRSDPRAYPREETEEDGAEFWTDALRYALDRAKFSKTKSKVMRRVLINGFGGAYVGVNKTRDGKIDITVKEIPWDRLWYDPHSAEEDFSDARYVGFDTWYDDAQAKRRFPNGGDALDATPSAQGEDLGGTYDDKPKWKIWSDTKRKRVRVSEMYFKDENDAWNYACFTRGGELEPSKIVTYIDENQEPECPLQLVSAYVDRENNRHGIVRDLVPVQDEINKRRQKALHLITMRQARVSRGASVDAKSVSTQLAKPDGIITADKDEFEILPTNDMSAGNLALLESAKADMQLMGPNAAAQGKDPRNLSGRAQQLMQNGAQTELTPVKDNLKDWQHRITVQVKNRIKQFWTDEMVIRVTDDERNIRFVGLNKMVPAGQVLIEKLTKKAGAPPPQEVIDQIMADPRAQEMVKQNDIAATDVDIIIDEQPDVVTLQAETFESLAKMVAAGMPIPPDVILEAAPLPSQTKRAITDKMEEAAKQGPPPDPAAEAKAAETQAKLAMEQQKMQADAAKTQADLQLKAMEIEAQREQMAFERVKMDFEIQKMNMQAQMQASQMAVQREMHMADIQDRQNERDTRTQETASAPKDTPDALPKALEAIAMSNHALAQGMTKPRSIVRGADGRAEGLA